jgi:glycosyltransferase involved in cell wall biosynthesis
MTRSKLAVIVPAWNEEGAVAEVVRAVRNSVPLALVMVIDDHSSDSTASVAEQAGARVIRMPLHLGLDLCLRAGYQAALESGCDYVIRIDGDGQHEAADIPGMLAALERRSSDAIIGSRFIQPNGWRPTFVRSMGIALFRELLAPALGKTIHDPTSGFVGFNRQALEALMASRPRVYPEIGALITLRRNRLRFREIPCRMYPRRTGQSSFTARRSFHYTICVLAGILCNAAHSAFFLTRTGGRRFESE